MNFLLKTNRGGTESPIFLSFYFAFRFISLYYQINDEKTARCFKKEIIARRYIPFKAGESVVVHVLTKVGKPNQGSGKHKRGSDDFRKKTHFKQQQNQIVINRRGEGTHYVSFETHELLFSILLHS